MNELAIKRLADADGEGESKRRAIELSEDGPLTQRDIVYFKKEAIWRQMSFYKQKYLQLLTDLLAIQSKYELSEKKVRTLDIWYEQIINLLANGVENGQENQLLLVKLDSETNLDELLEKRRSALLKAVTPLKANGAPKESSELEKQVELLNFELFTLKADNETIRSQKEDLQLTIQLLQTKVDSLLRETDRKESLTLKRVAEDKEIKKEEENNDSPVKVEENGVSKEQLESFNIQITELKSENSALKDLLTKLNASLTSFQNESETLSKRLNDLNDADLNNSGKYMDLKESNNYLKTRVKELERINETNASKITTLESRQGDYVGLINKELSDANSSLKSQLLKTEEDLVRIRSIRDELLGKQSILKAEMDNKETSELLLKINKVLRDHVEHLEKTKSEDADKVELDGMSEEDLLKRIGMLQRDIKEVENAFRETREATIKKIEASVDQESLLKKLTIEKNKADQKYFASMRSRDALTAENKVLKAQVTKLQDFTTKSNELEATYLEKIEILNKSINDYKSIKQSSITEISQLTELLAKANSRKSIIEEQLKETGAKLLQITHKSSELEISSSEKEIALKKLESKLKATETLLQKYKLNNTSSIMQEDEKQLEALRSITRCSVCSKNWKDTVLTGCGHVFCNKCTLERLAARLRRCPSCNKGFSANDLLSIHL